MKPLLYLLAIAAYVGAAFAMTPILADPRDFRALCVDGPATRLVCRIARWEGLIP